MAFEQRDNSGTLFVNDRKQSDKQPDRSGSAMIGGKMYRVSGWIKSGAKGQFLSLSFTLADEQPARKPPPDIQPPGGNAPQARRASMKDTIREDEVPF